MIYDESFVQQKREELTSTLFGLSLPAGIQMQVVGPPFPGEELTVDFFGEFSQEMRENYRHYDTLPLGSYSALANLELQFRRMQETLDSSVFLDPDELHSNDAWEKVRKLAGNALRAMKVDPTQLCAEVESDVCGGVSVHRWRAIAQRAEQDVDLNA